MVGRRAFAGLLLAAGPLLAAMARPCAAAEETPAGALGDNVDQAIDGVAGAAGRRFRDLRIDTHRSVRAGHGVQLNAPGLNNWTFSGVEIDAKGYGLLVNTQAGNSSGLLMTDFRIAAKADAIELNTPEGALRNSVIWGGHLSQEAGTGADAGFALGASHVDGLVAGGFISHGSRLEGIHIETGSRMVVLSSFVLRNCGRDGLRLLPGGVHPSDYAPVVVSAFAAEGTRVPNTYGLYCISDPTGFAGRTIAVGGYLTGFSTGVWLDGRGLFAADQISVEDVEAVLELGDGARAPGSFFSRGARVFVRARGAGVAGRFHQEDAAPAKIVERVGRGYCAVAGFSFPLQIGDAPVRGFSAGAHISGRLSLVGSSGFWEGRVYGGPESLVATDVRAVGSLQNLKLAIENGDVMIHGATGGELILSFEGSYVA